MAAAAYGWSVLMVDTFAGGDGLLRGSAVKGLLQPCHRGPHILGSLQPLPMPKRYLVVDRGDVLTQH